MAELILDWLPSKPSVGEGRVFDLVQRLPRDCIAYYKPAIRNQHTDFVVMMMGQSAGASSPKHAASLLPVPMRLRGGRR